MAYQVLLSEQAGMQLREIGFYLRCHISEKYAVQTVRKLREAVMRLADMPEHYAYARNIVLKRQGYRCAVCEKHLIFYRVLPSFDLVQVAAIVDGTQDYLNLIR